jgi:hypothetical protein
MNVNRGECIPHQSGRLNGFCQLIASGLLISTILHRKPFAVGWFGIGPFWTNFPSRTLIRHGKFFNHLIQISITRILDACGSRWATITSCHSESFVCVMTTCPSDSVPEAVELKTTGTGLNIVAIMAFTYVFIDTAQLIGDKQKCTNPENNIILELFPLKGHLCSYPKHGVDAIPIISRTFKVATCPDSYSHGLCL